MSQYLIVQINGFSLPVTRTLESLGCDVSKVVDGFNEELKSATLKTDKDGVPAKGIKAGLKVSISQKGAVTVKTTDNRIATISNSPLMRLKEIDQWAEEGCELFVRMELTLPDSIADHLGAKRYDSEARAKARVESEAKKPEPAGTTK